MGKNTIAYFCYSSGKYSLNVRFPHMGDYTGKALISLSQWMQIPLFFLDTKNSVTAEAVKESPDHHYYY